MIKNDINKKHTSPICVSYFKNSLYRITRFNGHPLYFVEKIHNWGFIKKNQQYIDVVWLMFT